MYHVRVSQLSVDRGPWTRVLFLATTDWFAPALEAEVVLDLLRYDHDSRNYHIHACNRVSAPR